MSQNVTKRREMSSGVVPSCHPLSDLTDLIQITRIEFTALVFSSQSVALSAVLPKGPSCTKNTTESTFNAETKFATAIAKRYGEVSEMLLVLEKSAANHYRK